MPTFTDDFFSFLTKSSVDNPTRLIQVWTEENDRFFAPLNTRTLPKEDATDKRIIAPLRPGVSVPIKQVFQTREGPLGLTRVSTAMKIDSLACSFFDRIIQFDIQSDHVTDFEFDNYSFAGGDFKSMRCQMLRAAKIKACSLFGTGFVPDAEAEVIIEFRIDGILEISDGTINMFFTTVIKFPDSMGEQQRLAITSGFSVVGYNVAAYIANLKE